MPCYSVQKTQSTYGQLFDLLYSRMVVAASDRLLAYIADSTNVVHEHRSFILVFYLTPQNTRAYHAYNASRAWCHARGRSTKTEVYAASLRAAAVAPHQTTTAATCTEHQVQMEAS